MLIGGLLLRLPGITTPSLEQRETEGALLAREWYLGDGAALPQWKQRVLRELRSSVKPIEPPLLDYATSLEWRLSGENFWFPRLVSAVFWVLGGIFLYLIGVRVTSRGGALIALALYLTWPYGVWLSRHFMPDGILVCSILAASLAVIRYWERPSGRRLAVAAALACVATAIKPGVAFLFLVGLFTSLAVFHRQLRRSLTSGRLPLFALAAASAATLYYVSGRYLTHFIWRGADTRRLTPDLLVADRFWHGWWNMVSYLLRFPQPQQYLALIPLAVGVTGIVLARGVGRAILLGLSLGYIAFGLAFANYTQTHVYYSLPLIPILALSIGLVGGRLLGIGGAAGRAAIWGAVVVLVAAAAFKSHAKLPEDHPRQTIADYRRIGELTGHTTRAVIVTPQLRTPAMYWGWTVGEAWDISDESHFPQWLNPADFDYLVVEDAAQLQMSPGLRGFARDLPVVARTSRYAVFNMRGRHG